MRWLPLFLIIWLVGCPTDIPSEGGEAVVTHPWELSTWDSPFPQPENGYFDPGHPKMPQVQQPPLAETDTFNPSLLPGSWLQLAISNPDGVTRRPIELMHRIDFTPNGKLVYHATKDGEDQPTSGTWEKTGPGMIRLKLGNHEGAPFRFQMNGDGFFYFNSGQPPQGYWFARIPEVFTETIMANRFQTNLGELHFIDVVGNSFSGTVSSEPPLAITGVYNTGVLILDWVESGSGNSGLAAFIVDADWSKIEGVWWINNFEAAPFGGEWTGTVKLPEAQPGV